MKRCWYCGKSLKNGYDLVVTIQGELRPVCHDDRMCRPHTGIRGRGEKPVIKNQSRNKALQKVKENSGKRA